MDSQCANTAKEALDVSRAIAARVSESGNWQLRAMGEVRSCTPALPCLSCTRGDIRLFALARHEVAQPPPVARRVDALVPE